MPRLHERLIVHGKQRGAALAVAMTLVTAVMLLAMTVVSETSVNTAMTRQLIAQIGARMATASALESILTEIPRSSGGAFERGYRMGPEGQFDTTVSVDDLGTVITVGENDETVEHRYFELTIETTGPRNARHERIHFFRMPTSAER